MTIEAMKMETAVTARTAGKVREIRVKEGQAVKAKELLMLLDWFPHPANHTPNRKPSPQSNKDCGQCPQSLFLGIWGLGT